MATEEYDAIVVGSGATGGYAAKELCEAGLKVAVLDQGKKLDPSEFTEHVLPHEQKFRGRPSPDDPVLNARPMQRRNYACSELNADFFINDEENPYTTPKDKPFWWIRGNKIGGRSIMWARQSYRFSDFDFKAASRDGYGEDWPISYADLAPYYDKVEEYIGVSGRREGWKALPDGKFLPPMPYTCGEEMLKKAVDGFGDRILTIGRCAVLTRPHNGRAACHYCGPCHRGCSTNSYFNSPGVTLADAEATGNLTIIESARARHVTLNVNGLADGVVYIDTETKEERGVKAPVVILCASTLESTRMLLNSDYGGLANSSGVLGHYLMDHTYSTGAQGAFHVRDGSKPEAANRPNGIYIPRFQNLDGPQEKNFIRGYGFQGGEGITSYQHAYNMVGFGPDFKDQVRDGNTSSLSLSVFGEMLPRFENSATLDGEVFDAFGIPVLHVNCVAGRNEAEINKHGVEQAVAMLEAAGCEDVTTRTTAAPPGFGIHEVGTARMGDDPKKSVLNKWNQTHDIKNLFVMDGSCFVTISCVNPTLTMMALTVRACEYLVDELKRGNLT